MSTEVEKTESKEVVFWSRAQSCRIANFSEEVRDGSGRITKPEGSIRFFDNMYITSNPAEIAFIRGSTALENGDVRECKSVEEARKMTAQRDVVKFAVKEERAEHNESTIIGTPGGA